MGLLGKTKKTKQKNEGAQAVADQPFEPTAEADQDDLFEAVIQVDDPAAEDQPAVQEEKKEEEDDPFAGGLMDIFTDDFDTGNDLAALADYLEDVDMESLLLQARDVAARLRAMNEAARPS